MLFFDIRYMAFELLGYPISFVELIGTLFGFISVYFASRTNILTWVTGIVNEFFLFILFFQVQLYADMFLQVYFFAVTLYGWYNWKKTPKSNSISTVNLKTRVGLIVIIILSTLLAALAFSNIHLFLPQYFKIKAEYPLVDSFVMVLSIVATVLLAQKKLETWYLWILIDLVCVFLFFKKGAVLLGLEYLVFLGLATYGAIHWRKALNND